VSDRRAEIAALARAARAYLELELDLTGEGFPLMPIAGRSCAAPGAARVNRSDVRNGPLAAQTRAAAEAPGSGGEAPTTTASSTIAESEVARRGPRAFVTPRGTAHGGRRSDAPPASVDLGSPAVSSHAPHAGPAAVPHESATFAAVAGTAPDRRLHLATLAAQAATCTRCELHAHRTRSVFARGNPEAELVFVGEGPGQQEDLQGLPFVGAAGKLLDRMIAAMGFGRDDVYVCNVVKCRPPNNRTPLPTEMHACASFLFAQLEAVRPRCIVALGRTAAMGLGCIGPETRQWRGVWSAWRGIPVMMTYHPAFLLRDSSVKRPVWEDLQRVMARLRELRTAPRPQSP
jgi:DNA polymerase